jgi:hypothetical protein
MEVEVTDSFYEFYDGLLADLTNATTTNWGGGHEPLRPMPSTVERVIQKRLDQIDPGLRQSFCERVRVRLDLLAGEGHPYAETLRAASARLNARR